MGLNDPLPPCVSESRASCKRPPARMSITPGFWEFAPFLLQKGGSGNRAPNASFGSQRCVRCQGGRQAGGISRHVWPHPPAAGSILPSRAGVGACTGTGVDRPGFAGRGRIVPRKVSESPAKWRDFPFPWGPWPADHSNPATP